MKIFIILLRMKIKHGNMLKPLKKLLTAVLAIVLMATSLSCAAADADTMLQLTFIGMYATSDGTYEARNLPGSFHVYQNGSMIGTVLLYF